MLCFADMANSKSLTQTTSEFLQAGLRPVEVLHEQLGKPVSAFSIKFTWDGADYEVSLRKLG
jgi:hypothetical protein